jgi:hypothetical protein
MIPITKVNKYSAYFIRTPHGLWLDCNQDCAMCTANCAVRVKHLNWTLSTQFYLPIVPRIRVLLRSTKRRDVYHWGPWKVFATGLVEDWARHFR